MKRIYVATLLFTSLLLNAQSLIWGGRFGGDGEDVTLAMHTDKLGNTYTTGYYTSTADFDITDTEFLLTTNMDFEIFIQKTAPDGTLLWAKSMGGEAGDYGTKITTDNEGNVYVTGVFQLTADFDPSAAEHLLTASGSLDIFVVKLSAAGDLLWAKNFEGEEYEEANGIGTDIDGNVYVSGYFYSQLDFDPSAATFLLTPQQGDGFLAKLDSDGAFLWAVPIGGAEFDLVTGMQTLQNGDVYVSGNFEQAISFDTITGNVTLTAPINSNGIFVCQVNAQGEFVKAAKVGHALNSGYGLSVAVDSQGGTYVTGYLGGNAVFETLEGTVTISPTDFINGYVARVSADGGVEWVRHLSGNGVTTGYIVAVNSMDEIFVNGYFNGTLNLGTISLTEESAGDTESFVAKLDNHGTFLWAVQLGGINTVDRSAMSIDPQDNILVSSAFEGTVDLDPGSNVLPAVSLGFRDNFLVKIDDGVLGVPEYSGAVIALHPNPVKDILHVSGDASILGMPYRIYDATGREVQHGVCDGEIDMRGLQTGLYHFNVGGQNHKVVKK